MIEMVKWIERQFHEKPDAGTFPMVVERVAGTPARVDEKLASIADEMVTARIGSAWTIQEHVGHLGDLEPLWMIRLEEFLAGRAELTGADMTNQRTAEAGHNERALGDVAREFRERRSALVSRLETLDGATVVRESLHPRLQKPMRVIDLCSFVAEHDDHHLARISEVWRALSGKSAVLSLDPRFQ